MRISRDPAFSTAPLVCAVLVTSRVRGVTRPSKWTKGWRVPAYTRFAPLLKASSTSACPIPRLAPVTRTALSAIVIPSRLIGSAPVSRCSYDDRGTEKESINANQFMKAESGCLSPRRHLVEFRQGWIDEVPRVAARAVHHHLRLEAAGIVEARSVHGEKI